MKFSTSLLSALSLGLSLAAPHGGHSTPANTTTTTDSVGTSDTVNILDETPGSGGSWDVIISEDDPRTLDDMLAAMNLTVQDVTNIYNNSAFKGFSASLSSHCVNQLEVLSSGWKTYQPQVEVKLHDSTDGTWGLKRVSQADKVQVASNQTIRDFDFTSYEFDGAVNTLGAGVDIYIVDTGVDITHVDFDNRATFGFTFDGTETDDVGHGTHCAGTAASTTFGLAKAANIIAVRVLSAETGNSNNILAGVDFVMQQHDQRKAAADFKGSVISMSLGTSGVSDAIDEVLKKASESGVHISVAAGNDDVDACLTSPALASQGTDILSVGAVDINDERATFSNFGACVSTYGPGVDVTSTWIKDPTLPNIVNPINTISGTSMATPHVTGLIAYHLGLNSSLATDTAAMKALIVGSSLPFQSDKNAPDPAILINNGILKQ